MSKNKKTKQTKTLIEKLVDASWDRDNRAITVMSEEPDSWPQLAEAMRRIGAGSGVNLDYSLDTVQVLEDLLLEARPLLAPIGAMCACIAGCYLGETLVRSLGGKWLYRAEGLPYVELRNGMFRANVIGKCSRLLRTGERGQHSLVAMVNAAQDFSRYSEEEVKAFMDKLNSGDAVHADGYTVRNSSDGHAE